MHGAWILPAIVSLGALALWARLAGRGRTLGRGSITLVTTAALGLTVTAAIAWDARARAAAERRTAFLATVPSEGRPGGYVSSNACRACHPSQHASWHRSFHRTMTQYAAPETVLGHFDGAALPLRGGRLTLDQRGDEFWMTTTRDGQTREHRIGLVTGSHHMQVYWVSDGAGNAQQMVPYAFLLEEQRWVPARDTFLADPSVEWRFDAWNGQCIQCHATGGQQRPEPGEPAPGHAPVMASRAAELGIACESCHGPAEAHLAKHRSPLERYLGHGGNDASIVNPRRLKPRASAEVCGQCHGITAILDHDRWQSEGFAYRPGDALEATRPLLMAGHPPAAPILASIQNDEPNFLANRYWPDGMVRVAGREWNGMLRSPCHQRGPMTCLSCHSMHEGTRDDQLARDRDGNQACLSCHEAMRDKLAAHTHHAPSSEGSRCYNCHMPHTTYGLLKAIRSHQIDSPSIAVTRATGRPDACNLCHLDRSLGWAAGFLQQWYGQASIDLSDEEREIAAAVVWLLRGDAGQRALAAWHMGWVPAQEASGRDWLGGVLPLALGDSYAAVRAVAARSLRRLPGFEDFSFDFAAPEAQIQRGIEDAAARWGRARRPVPPAKAARVLLRPDGGPLSQRLGDLISRRDQRSMDLRE